MLLRLRRVWVDWRGTFEQKTHSIKSQLHENVFQIKKRWQKTAFPTNFSLIISLLFNDVLMPVR